MIVSNASPIIFLIKIKKLDLLRKIYKKILLPLEVYKEIIIKEPSKRYYFESFKDLFVIKEVKEKLNIPGLHSGEEKAILLVKKERTEIILDEDKAREIAKDFGLKPIGTLRILLHSLKEKLINYFEFKELLNSLLEKGFRINTEIYIGVLKEAERYK